MKILVASHTYIVDLNCEKYKALSQLAPNLEVTVVVPKRWRPGGVQNRLIETQPRQEGNFRVVPLTNFSQNNQGLLCFGAELISLLRQFRPDIIQVEQGAKAIGYSQMITLNRLLGLGAKNLFFTWWNLPYDLKFPAAALESYNLRHTHGIISGNQDGADILRQRGYQGPIQVMPQLGVDETLFRPQAQPELAAQYGIQPDEFVVGFAGRFVPEKGLLTLYEALKQIGQTRPWKWLLIGRGPLQETVSARAAADGLTERLIWIESVPHAEVPHYINLMNTLVLPSETTAQFTTLTSTGWKEQFGHVLIEAMACQVPVIGSDSGEIPHVIGDAGLTFPEGDVSALQERLLELIDQPERAAQLGKLGHDRVLTRYTNLAIAQQQLNFYRQLVNQPVGETLSPRFGVKCG
ncbi:MAG: hormogonium polysaccharide biosynthesis glycosyltransferase HpsO [Elainella sp.]